MYEVQLDNGNIILIHGDCLEVMPKMESGIIDLILADLPYGTTGCKWDSVLPLDILWKEYKRIRKIVAATVLTASTPFDKVLGVSNLEELKYEWIWEKNKGSNFANVRYMPMKEHENILVFAKGKTVYNAQRIERSESGKKMVLSGTTSKGFRQDDFSVTGNMDKGHTNAHLDPNTRVPRTVLKFNTEVGKHPTQKPVALMEYLIKTYTNEGDLVLDNTMGSGTTAVACVNTGRRFIGIEKEQEYFDICIKRCVEALAEKGK
jgi:DNA modification methylase